MRAGRQSILRIFLHYAGSLFKLPCCEKENTSEAYPASAPANFVRDGDRLRPRESGFAAGIGGDGLHYQCRGEARHVLHARMDINTDDEPVLLRAAGYFSSRRDERGRRGVFDRNRFEGAGVISKNGRQMPLGNAIGLAEV